MSTYRGRVRDGHIELEDDVKLPEGTAVRVELLEPPAPADDPVCGLADEAVDTGIPDLSAEHDHYTYGTPRRGGG